MRHESSFPANSIAYEVDPGYIESGDSCTCPLCRPHGNLLSFVSRDNLHLDHGLPPSHRFTRQRLNHRFTTLSDAADAHNPPVAYDKLTLKRKPNP